MKKLFYLFFMAAAIVFAGCSDKSSAVPPDASAVKGHTYQYSSGSTTISFYFASSGSCRYAGYSGGSSTIYNQLVYRIDGYNVDVYTDNSTYWKESGRNVLFTHLIYEPNKDQVITDNGLALSRAD